MKKALSVLLAILIGFSCIVCASAKAEPPKAIPGESVTNRFRNYVDMPGASLGGAATAQGVLFELPVVTGIEAVWNGPPLLSEDLTPAFSPKNVSITLSYAEGEPETLPKWYNESMEWFWEVFYEFNPVTGDVTFYYIDSNLFEAYLATLGGSVENYSWPDLALTLQKTTITVPTDLVMQYINSKKPIAALALDQSVTVTSPYTDLEIFAFTPAEDGCYFFSSFTEYGDPFAGLTDDEGVLLYWDDDLRMPDFGIAYNLEAGETYYLFTSSWYGNANAGGFDVTVSKLAPISPFMQWIYRNLLFGWLWMDSLTHNQQYMYPGVTVGDIISIALLSLLLRFIMPR